MTKSALCIGINDYPGTNNDLNGCVNDANDWAGLLADSFGFAENLEIILNEQATKTNILSSLGRLIDNATPGDSLVFTYSGHGTWTIDQGILDEPDNRDEAICAFDGNVIDDEIRAIINSIRKGVNLTVISDSCFSGGVTREMFNRTCEFDRNHEQSTLKPRFMPPRDSLFDQRYRTLPVRRRLFYADSSMPEVLLTGCNSTEYSYDAYLNGQFNGAMTANAIEIIKRNPEQSYLEMFKDLRKILPSSRFPQHPQLEGSAENVSRKIFS